MQRERGVNTNETQTKGSWASKHQPNGFAPWPTNSVDTGILPHQPHHANKHYRQQYENNVDGHGYFNSTGEYTDYYSNDYGDYDCGYDDEETYGDEGYGHYNSDGYHAEYYSNYYGESSCGTTNTNTTTTMEATIIMATRENTSMMGTAQKRTTINAIMGVKRK